jgi:hypothetical protein
MDPISDETKADVVLAAVRDSGDRLIKVLWDIVEVSSVNAVLFGDSGEKLRWFTIASEKVDRETDAAKYVRFLRKALKDEKVTGQIEKVLTEAERIVLSRFTESRMERALLTLEVMDE